MYKMIIDATDKTQSEILMDDIVHIHEPRENRQYAVNYIGLFLVLAHLYAGNITNHNMFTRITGFLQLVIAVPLFWYPYILFYRSIRTNQHIIKIFSPDIAIRFIALLFALTYVCVSWNVNSSMIAETIKIMQIIFLLNSYFHILSYKMKSEKGESAKKGRKIKKITLMYKQKVVKEFHLL